MSLTLAHLDGMEHMLQIIPMVAYHESAPKPTAATKALDTMKTWHRVS